MDGELEVGNGIFVSAVHLTAACVDDDGPTMSVPITISAGAGSYLGLCRQREDLGV